MVGKISSSECHQPDFRGWLLDWELGGVKDRVVWRMSTDPSCWLTSCWWEKLLLLTRYLQCLPSVTTQHRAPHGLLGLHTVQSAVYTVHRQHTMQSCLAVSGGSCQCSSLPTPAHGWRPSTGGCCPPASQLGRKSTKWRRCRQESSERLRLLWSCSGKHSNSTDSC